MRHFDQKLNELLSCLDSQSLIPIIEDGLHAAKCAIQTYEIIGDTDACRALQKNILQAELVLSFLYLRGLDLTE